MKVGDYVRTTEGYICKILEIHEEYGDEYLDWNDIHSASIRKSHIIKSSSNIIDLIEAGDYVNGYKVSFIDEEPVLGKFVQCDYPVQYGSTNHYRFYEMKIKSIVTKEQFSSMEYKVN